MTIFDISTQVERQGIQLEKSRAVLLAATEEVQDYAKYKAFRDEHTMLLLHVVDDLLIDVLPKLTETTYELIEKQKVIDDL